MAVRLLALRSGHPLPPGGFLILISVRDCLSLGHNAAGGLGKLKNLTTSGGKSATFRLVAQCQNQLRYLNLGTSLKSVMNLMPKPLYPWGKSLWYSLNRKLYTSKNQCGRRGDVKYLAFTWNRPTLTSRYILTPTQ
jgi:hypothetical protein